MGSPSPLPQLFERSQGGFRRCLDDGATPTLLQALEIAVHPAVPPTALPTYHDIDPVHLRAVLLPLYMQYMLRFHQADINAFRCGVLLRFATALTCMRN